jgi:toxin ParE1/3/4
VKVVWLKRAVADLARARGHIARDNPAAAQRVAERVKEAVARLEAFPGIGRQGRVPGTRELVVSGTPFVIPYRVRENTVEILRVLHGARLYP